MPNSPHTASPWFWSYFNSYSTQITAADGKFIADICDERDWKAGPGQAGIPYQDGEAWANAYLITQSPAMYDLLERVVAVDGKVGDILMAEIKDIINRVDTGHETSRDRLSASGG